ncbi:MAG TPA: metallophosphoesterase [Vicinamibacterales bacterium]|nr:metallophosphoesterase [Vicinamibacterales bacterium]
MTARRVPPLALLALVATMFAGCASAPAARSPHGPPAPPAVRVTLPLVPDSVRFAVIGDSGTGGRRQYEVAERLAEAHAQFAFTFTIMLGDNLYGSERPRDYARKFEVPYKPLLDAGVNFYATLGNHDEPAQRMYGPFNMGGERYYTFTKGPVEFFVLDTTNLDPEQVDWLRRQLDESGARWKIAYFHHPLYSSGRRHGPATELRAILEPLFVEHGVSAVFAGHEHFYERIRPQKGITYFTAGGSGRLRAGDIRKTSQTAAGFDRDRSFMLVEIAGDTLHFQAISRTGQTVDSGSLPRREPAGIGEAPNSARRTPGRLAMPRAVARRQSPSLSSRRAAASATVATSSCGSTGFATCSR